MQGNVNITVSENCNCIGFIPMKTNVTVFLGSADLPAPYNMWKLLNNESLHNELLSNELLNDESLNNELLSNELLNNQFYANFILIDDDYMRIIKQRFTFHHTTINAEWNILEWYQEYAEKFSLITLYFNLRCIIDFTVFHILSI